MSSDNLQWFTVFTNDNYNAEENIPLEAVFPVIPVRYIKVIIPSLTLDDNGYYYAVISEIEVIHAQSDPGTIVAKWTATGDDDNEGDLAEYLVRYSTCPFDESTATEVTSPKPNHPGESELIRITGLTQGTYCIAVTAIDESGNQSPMSNPAEIFTPGI
jgi:hypothetical protein